MSKIIKGPWKPRDYDPTKDPEFKLESGTPVWAVGLTIVFVIFAVIVLYQLGNP